MNDDLLLVQYHSLVLFVYVGLDSDVEIGSQCATARAVMGMNPMVKANGTLNSHATAHTLTSLHTQRCSQVF